MKNLVSLKKFVSLILLLVLLISCHACFADRPKRVEVSLKGGELYLVDAHISGKKATVLLDSGAPSVFVSPSYFGFSEGQRVVLNRLCFKELCFKDVDAHAKETPFSDSGEINALVGMSILARMSVEFDHQKSVTFVSDSSLCRGVEVAMSFDGYMRPFANIVIDGTVFEDVLVDTGAAFTLINEAAVSRLSSYVKNESSPARGCSINGCSDKYFVSKVNEVCVGPICSDAVDVKFPVWNALGYSFLSRHKVAMDFVGGRLIFCEG